MLCFKYMNNSNQAKSYSLTVMDWRCPSLFVLDYLLTN